ncbi:anaphase-promoting complex subunit 11-like protein, partial [Trifolium pratense]
RWHAVASWTWDAQDETCGICRMAFDGCCPDCKLPGDDCPLSMDNSSIHGRKPKVRRINLPLQPLASIPSYGGCQNICHVQSDFFEASLMFWVVMLDLQSKVQKRLNSSKGYVNSNGNN